MIAPYRSGRSRGRAVSALLVAVVLGGAAVFGAGAALGGPTAFGAGAAPVTTVASAGLRAAAGWGLALPAASPGPAPAPPPAPAAKAYLLMDATTGAVLAENNADEPLALASLTKIMTLHLTLRALRAGRLAPGEVVRVPNYVREGMPPDSSVMGLRPGDPVSVKDLVFGAAVGSANDACVVLAEAISGSPETFVAEMNREAARLGLHTASFADPHGLSPLDRMSARDLSRLVTAYLDETPEALNYHATREYAYSGRLLRNRNGLLGAYPGADGLKTGHTSEAGYSLVGTAERDGTRLVAIVMGVGDKTATEGGGEGYRDAATAALLDWGFANFATVRPLEDPLARSGASTGKRATAGAAGWPEAPGAPSADLHWTTRPEEAIPVLGRLGVFGGARTEVPVGAARPVAVTVRKGSGASVTTKIEAAGPLVSAPVHAGDKLGAVVVYAGGVEIGRFDLVALATVPRGGWTALVQGAWKLIGLPAAGSGLLRGPG